MHKGIIDNKQTGLVGDVLKEHISKGSKISVVAAHFTLYAFVKLKKELSKVDEFRFIFTEPAFIDNKDFNKMQIEKNEALLYGVDEEHKYKMELTQGYIARELAKWLRSHGNFKSVTKQKIKGGLYHVENKDGSQIGLSSLGSGN